MKVELQVFYGRSNPDLLWKKTSWFYRGRYPVFHGKKPPGLLRRRTSDYGKRRTALLKKSVLVFHIRIFSNHPLKKAFWSSIERLFALSRTAFHSFQKRHWLKEELRSFQRGPSDLSKTTFCSSQWRHSGPLKRRFSSSQEGPSDLFKKTLYSSNTSSGILLYGDPRSEDLLSVYGLIF